MCVCVTLLCARHILHIVTHIMVTKAILAPTFTHLESRQTGEHTKHQYGENGDKGSQAAGGKG